MSSALERLQLVEVSKLRACFARSHTGTERIIFRKHFRLHTQRGAVLDASSLRNDYVIQAKVTNEPEDLQSEMGERRTSNEKKTRREANLGRSVSASTTRAVVLAMKAAAQWRLDHFDLSSLKIGTRPLLEFCRGYPSYHMFSQGQLARTL
jgi:hypothetical protein